MPPGPASPRKQAAAALPHSTPAASSDRADAARDQPARTAPTRAPITAAIAAASSGSASDRPADAHAAALEPTPVRAPATPPTRPAIEPRAPAGAPAGAPDRGAAAAPHPVHIAGAHGGSGASASPLAEPAAAASPAHSPSAADGPDLDPPSPAGELGRSSARVTVGEGDDRVSLLIAVRGDSVRIEARAHSAVYADSLHQRADELASGLAEHGLHLGSLSADVAGDRAAQQPAPQPDDRPGRHRAPEPDRSADPDPTPTRPRPRGLRAIA
ncbi:MAG TPA: hypothetical protein VKB80_10925 [Kofleriaceae bacterium]|nr:hypothetical protein [Kofleriaceae bacterium]